MKKLTLMAAIVLVAGTTYGEQLELKAGLNHGERLSSGSFLDIDLNIKLKKKK